VSEGVAEVQASDAHHPLAEPAPGDMLDHSQIRAHEGCQPGVNLNQRPPGASLQEEMLVGDQTIQQELQHRSIRIEPVPRAVLDQQATQLQIGPHGGVRNP
jgi:hypothetical protein